MDLFTAICRPRCHFTAIHGKKPSLQSIRLRAIIIPQSGEIRPGKEENRHFYRKRCFL